MRIIPLIDRLFWGLHRKDLDRWLAQYVVATSAFITWGIQDDTAHFILIVLWVAEIVQAHTQKVMR